MVPDMNDGKLVLRPLMASMNKAEAALLQAGLVIEDHLTDSFVLSHLPKAHPALGDPTELALGGYLTEMTIGGVLFQIALG